MLHEIRVIVRLLGVQTRSSDPAGVRKDLSWGVAQSDYSADREEQYKLRCKRLFYTFVNL